MKPRLFRLSYFAWIVVLVAASAAAFAVYQAWGLPHLAWSYAWIDDGAGYDPFAERHYTRCTYVGFTGEFTTYPDDGACPVLSFFKRNAGGG